MNWKAAQKAEEERKENERHRQFIDNVSRYDPDMTKE